MPFIVASASAALTSVLTGSGDGTAVSVAALIAAGATEGMRVSFGRSHAASASVAKTSIEADEGRMASPIVERFDDPSTLASARHRRSADSSVGTRRQPDRPGARAPAAQAAAEK